MGRVAVLSLAWLSPSIWYKTSANGGVTWSADTRLTAGYSDYAPAAAVDVGWPSGGGLESLGRAMAAQQQQWRRFLVG